LTPFADLVALEGTELVHRLAASGLRGRGGGWFPAARKWNAVRVEEGEPFLVANGAEGEPGSIKDRALMLTRPGDVLRGVTLAAHAVGAREAIVFLKASFGACATRLADALEEEPPSGITVTIRHGDDSYITGEETAALEALEGRRPWPRPKPPLPAAVGFHGRPTLVQNVETLARVPAALADPDAYGRDETTLVSLWGAVRRPGVYEVPLGIPLARVIEENGGGATGAMGMVFPGGPSAAPLAPAELGTALDPDALKAAGSGLGTASVLVVGASACPLAVAVSLASFFERESCGQCPPCTMGTGSLLRIVRALESGAARGRDLGDVTDVAGFMSMHGYCAHSRTAAASVTGLLARFRADVEAHLAAGRCPRLGTAADPFGADSPERAAIEAALTSITGAPAASNAAPRSAMDART
jgi:NADH:ubiquinone oxidoreductase subunit F (NADH-binding)